MHGCYPFHPKWKLSTNFSIPIFFVTIIIVIIIIIIVIIIVIPLQKGQTNGNKFGEPQKNLAVNYCMSYEMWCYQDL